MALGVFYFNALTGINHTFKFLPIFLVSKDCASNYVPNPASNPVQNHVQNDVPCQSKTCEVCGKTFTKNKARLAHIRQFHQPNMLKYICSVEGCNTSLSTKYLYREHCRNIHSGYGLDNEEDCQMSILNPLAGMALYNFSFQVRNRLEQFIKYWILLNRSNDPSNEDNKKQTKPNTM